MKLCNKQNNGLLDVITDSMPMILPPKPAEFVAFGSKMLDNNIFRANFKIRPVDETEGDLQHSVNRKSTDLADNKPRT